MALKAEIRTPGARDEPDAIEEIPLPPEHLWKDLDNSGQPAPVAAPAEATSPPADDIAMLDFVEDGFRTVVPLKHPFRWQGARIDAIAVRRLTIGEVSQFVRRVGSRPLTTFDVYALMTGLPAAVLRGLIDEDGEKVTEVAYDFLPPQLRTDAA